GDRARRDARPPDPRAGGDEALRRLELVDALLARPRPPRSQLRGRRARARADLNRLFAMNDDLAFAGAAKQAEMLRAGEVSPAELVQLCLDRIARIDPQLNAFRKVFAEKALLEAQQAESRLKAGEERPLLGVPVAIKDEVAVAGEVKTFGTDAF